MTWYVAVWKDPYNKREIKTLAFGEVAGTVVRTSPFMPWAEGRALTLVRQYFHSNHVEFHEANK